MTDRISFTLWDKTIEFDTVQYVVKQLCDGVEFQIKENTDTIVSNRLNGVPFKISHVQGKDAWDIVPYMWDNTEYIKSVIADTKHFVNGILSDHGVTINPNWQEINSQWLAQLKKIEVIFSDALKTCTQAAMQNQVIRYNQAYNEELSKDFGLSFGILSNSLTAHLVYAAQETAKERKDHERASRVAAEAMNNADVKITLQVYENVHPLYVDSVEPALLKLLSEYYAYIVSIFANEVGTTPDEIKNTFDEKKSDDMLCGNFSNPQEAIVGSLEIDPDNGNVIGYAICKGALDDALCVYGKNSSPKFQDKVKKWAEKTLCEIHNAGKLFSKPIINDENREIIDGLIRYYSVVDGDIRKSKEWQDILINVYGKEIAAVIQDFSQISLLILSPLDFNEVAKKQTSINISDTNRQLFELFSNELHVDTIIKTAEIMKLECPISINAINNSIKAFKDKLVNARNEMIQKEDQKRKEAEEAERIRKEQERKEKEIRKQKRRKGIKRFSILTGVLTAVIAIFVVFILPIIYYSIANSAWSNQNYGKAAIYYGKAGSFKDSSEKSNEAWNFVDNNSFLCGSKSTAVAIKNDGTVVAMGLNQNNQCDLSSWENIVSVSAGQWHTVGLKADGTVVAKGQNKYGECDVSSWKEIVTISANNSYTLGLRKDGTVIATGENDWGQCNVNGWRKIVAISAGEDYAIGIRYDGTVVSTSVVKGEDTFSLHEPNFGQTNISDWKNIVSVKAGEYMTAAIKEDGTLYATKIDSSVFDVMEPYYFGQDKIENWKDVTDIAIGSYHSVAVLKDGTVISTRVTGDNFKDQGQYLVSAWKDVVGVAAGDNFTIGVKSNGTIEYAGTGFTYDPDNTFSLPTKYFNVLEWTNLKTK